MLLLFDDKSFALGNPYLSNALVTAKVLHQGRQRKMIVFKYGPKDRTRKKRGFRAEYTEIEITALKS